MRTTNRSTERPIKPRPIKLTPIGMTLEERTLADKLSVTELRRLLPKVINSRRSDYTTIRAIKEGIQILEEGIHGSQLQTSRITTTQTKYVKERY